jgi:hypothetical protein
MYTGSTFLRNVGKILSCAVGSSQTLVDVYRQHVPPNRRRKPTSSMILWNVQLPLRSTSTLPRNLCTLLPSTKFIWNIGKRLTLHDITSQEAVLYLATDVCHKSDTIELFAAMLTSCMSKFDILWRSRFRSKSEKINCNRKLQHLNTFLHWGAVCNSFQVWRKRVCKT